MPKRITGNSHTSKKSLLFILAALVLLPLLIWQVGLQQIFRQNAAPAARPNFIVIMTDDQPYNEMETVPVVTRTLADKGITFTNAYLTDSLCCPSRASFLSSLYSHNTGVWSVHGNDALPAFLDNEKSTIATWMKKGGYRTGIIGKYLNGLQERPNHRAPGWDTWFVMPEPDYYDYTINNNGRMMRFGNKPNDYSTDVLGKEAVEFIKKSDNQPFFLLFTPYAPHGAEKDRDNRSDLGLSIPAPKYENCNVSKWTTPISFNEQDVSDKPNYVKNLPRVPENEAEAFRQTQLCSLKSVNDVIEDMLRALGNKRDDTVIIYLTDNGFSYGQHRVIKKHCFYEECSRTPLVISYPGMITKKLVSPVLVQQIDIAPTIAELAGVSYPKSIDGKSLVPLFTKPNDQVHDYIFMEQKGKTPGEAVRFENFKYMEYNTGEKEFYNLTRDPHELSNAIKEAEYKTVMEKMAVYLYLSKQQRNSGEDSPPGPGDGTNPPTDTPAPEKLSDKELISKRSSDLIPANDPDYLKCSTVFGDDGVVIESLGDLCVPKSPLGFASQYYRIGLSFIGALSVLFIIIGGYIMVTSQGNPQRIKSGKTYIFYALFGLILSIFGFVFAEVIAVDILRIPGFGR